jgi:2-methylcitrate dehydratase PrpD
MDVALDLAEHIVDTRFENLPAEVVAVTKKFIADSVGVGLAGSGSPGNAEIIAMLNEWGGRQDSRVFVYGSKLPAPMAAFANSLLIHSADYDDTFDKTATHTNVTTLPAALAISEMLGCSGKEVITAVALGVDLICRLAMASHLFHGWHNTTTLGIFGAVAAAGKLLNLDSTRMRNALGIAYSQASGNRQGREDGAQTKRLQPAFATQAGVTSALLSQKGISGATNIFQGQWGFFSLYRDYAQVFEPDHWASALTDGLGSRFEGVSLGAKPYPCVRCSHAPIDGALALAKKYDIVPDQISRVTVYTNERVIDTAGRPFVIRSNPEVDAKFSIPYTIAVALTNRRVTLNDFKEETITKPDLIQLAEKVNVEIGPEFQGTTSTMGPIDIRIHLTNGDIHATRVEIASGHPDNPMSEQAHLDKFMDCAGASAMPLPGRNIEVLLEKLDALENQDEMAEITRLTAP